MFSTNQKRIFAEMINQTKLCLQNTNPQSHEAKVKCETALFSDLDGYTYHTHPNGTPEPSDIDIRTTARHKKKYLAIGLVPQNEVIVWGEYPTYNKIITRFKL